MKPTKQTSSTPAREAGPWDGPALAKVREWDPVWVDQCLKMSDSPWTSNILPRKEVELISVAVNAGCTNLSEGGTRRHIRGALEAGATREEILMILKIASLLAIHTCSLGAPILLEEAKAAGMKPGAEREGGDAGLRQDEGRGPMEHGLGRLLRDRPGMDGSHHRREPPGPHQRDPLAQLAEFLSIAVDASITHMYAPGACRHIEAALKLGATMEEIMEVLKICVSQGMQASNLGVPILAEELERIAKEA